MRRLTRREVLQESGVVAAGLMLAGCGGSGGRKGAKPEELVVAQASLWTTLDQEFSVEHETQEAQVNQGARLIRYRYLEDADTGFGRQDVSGKTAGFEPELAESFEVSDDLMTYTFQLRKGIVSPAGNELTADDVVYTFERKFGVNALGAFISVLSMDVKSVDQIERVDDYTVRFRLKRPFATFLHGIGNAHAGTIVDSKLLKSKATASDKWAQEFAKRNSHGFGPYYVDEYEQGKRALWRANEHYALGAPKIKRMVWKVVPDSATRLSLVLKGDVHIAKQMVARELDQADGKPDITIPSAFTNLSVHIPLPYKVKPFDDTRVHQAFLYAIPYDEIINTVYRGRARRQYGMLWDPVTGAHPEYWKKYQTDLDKARQLLTEAGLPNGFETEFGYSLATPDMEEVAILLRQSMAKVGIKLNLKGLTPSALNEMHTTVGGSAIPHIIRDYAIVQTPAYSLLLFFTPDTIPNFAGYQPPRANSAKFLAAVDRAIDAGDDQAAAAQADWEEAQRILAEDSPWAYIAWVDPPHIFRSNVKGYAHRTDNVLDYGRLRFTS